MSEDSDKEMPFLDHLEEVRTRLAWSLLALGLGSAVGIVAVFQFGVMDLLTEPLYAVARDLAQDHPNFLGLLGTDRLVFMNLTEPFFFVLKLGISVGFLLASPVLVYHAWAFLVPALKPREKRLIIPTLFAGLALFAAGATLAYTVALPMTIRFLLLFGSEWFTPALTAGHYLALVFRLLLAFGAVFELPVVVVLLSALGLVTPAFLRSKRRHAIVIITVLASLLSPGDFVQVTILLMVPMIALYEVSIVLSALVNRTSDSRVDEEPPIGTVALLGLLALRRRVQEV